MFQSVPAGKARSAIKRVLKQGGYCSVEVENVRRMLSHDLMDRPLEKLPWPFSSLQAHDVRYVEARGTDILKEQVFGKNDIDRAIDTFLNGIDPSRDILIVPE